MMTGWLRWLLVSTLLFGMARAQPVGDVADYLVLAARAATAAKASEPGTGIKGSE
jgi:hypothetical protein